MIVVESIYIYILEIGKIMNERGIWTTREEIATHQFDESIAVTISKMFPVIRTVADIGCGNGDYTKYLNSTKIKCSGYDGSPLTEEITSGECYIMDFSVPVVIGTFDLVLCLEVGEHIPAQYEKVFIDNICNAARKLIILSWAVPGQGGTGHVNCHDNEYIIYKISRRGFGFYPELTKRLRRDATLSWFKDTLMAFRWKI